MKSLSRIRALSLFSVVAAATAILVAGQAAQVTPQLGKDAVADVVAAMTLEEKAALLVGAGMSFGPGGPPGAPAPTVGDSLTLVPGAAGATVAIPRLGIPATVLADGPAGLRISPTREGDAKSYHATAFPVATLLASSWDTELVYQVGQAMGKEALEYGVDILLAPGLNIHRDPLGGRNFEYYSEDPLVTGKMAAAMVRGVQSQGVGTSIKHFAANNQETNRNALNVRVSQKALREIYLKGFQIAVRESQPWTVMSSYNKINGPYTSESRELLTDVLRSDWGFEGYVTTDWFGGSDPVAQMAAGNDLLMPGTPMQRTAVIEAVKEGRLEESVLDRNVERFLKIVLKTPRFKGYPYSNNPDLKAHAALARRAAAEGMALLKNEERTLPLNPDSTLALFGNASYDTTIGGSGSGDVNEAYSISIAEGLKEAGFQIDEKLMNLYRGYIEKAKEERPKPQFWFLPHEPIDEMSVSVEEVRRLAEGTAKAAVVTLGRTSGEFGDRDESDFSLKAAEKALIHNVSREFKSKGKKTIVVLNVGGAVETASWKTVPDAILIAWQPGQEAGHSLADVLAGKVNPSGKLATTFPVKYEDVPSSANFPGVELEAGESQTESGGGILSLFRGKPAEVTYEEDVYVGYRYYETFEAPSSYEFGYGLSYTKFDYSDLRLDRREGAEGTKVALTVKNSGDVAGREAVQIYVSPPTEGSPKALVGFAKTRLLQPGETEQLRLELEPLDYASFDVGSSSWVLEPGTYRVHAAASVKDVRRTESFRIERRTVVKRVRNVLAPDGEIRTIRPQGVSE